MYFVRHIKPPIPDASVYWHDHSWGNGEKISSGRLYFHKQLLNVLHLSYHAEGEERSWRPEIRLIRTQLKIGSQWWTKAWNTRNKKSLSYWDKGWTHHVKGQVKYQSLKLFSYNSIYQITHLSPGTLQTVKHSLSVLRHLQHSRKKLTLLSWKTVLCYCPFLHNHNCQIWICF